MQQIAASTKWRINILLVVIGAVGGALASIPLTWIGKLIAGAEPATITNYIWNMGAFGIMGALFSPVLTWSAMRRVPLWRTVLEPAVGGLVGAVIGFLLASTGGLFLLAAAGIGLGTWRLNYAYREPSVRTSMDAGDTGNLTTTKNFRTPIDVVTLS